MSRRIAVVVALVVILAVGAGIASYLMGRTGGEDLAAARSEGHRAGISRGYAAGTQAGFRRGFKVTRGQGHDAAYRRAYVAAYRLAFARAGLGPPKHVRVPRP